MTRERGEWARGVLAQGAVVAMAGACLGYWMFAARGAALFAAVGAAAVVALRMAGARAPRLAAALALLLAAAGLHSASTLGWAGADAPGGTRYKASPVGVSHVLTPDRLTSRTRDCGWHAASGYAAPCVVASGAAFRRLRTVYPLVLAAVALCLAGAALSLRTARWSRRAQRVAAMGAAVLALVAVLVFAGSVADALALLAGLSVGVGGTLGTMQLSAAVLLCLAVFLPGARAAAPHAASSRAAPGAARQTIGVAGPARGVFSPGDQTFMA